MNLAPIIEKWDGILLQCYNACTFVSSLFLSYKKRDLLTSNLKLKDKHHGERCFVIMNGPSINAHDLSPLCQEIVFCSNFFYKSPLFNVVKPNYYCWSDSRVFKMEEAKDVFAEICNNCPELSLILNMKGVSVLGRHPRIHYTYCKHLPNVFSVNSDMTKRFSNFSTVAFMAINAAIYMGFSEIYVLGLDFEPGAFKHFTNLGIECVDPNQENRKQDVCGNYWNYTKAHYESFYLNQIAQKKGARIINLNPNSRIRAFEFACYEDIIKQ